MLCGTSLGGLLCTGDLLTAPQAHKLNQGMVQVGFQPSSPGLQLYLIPSSFPPKYPGMYYSGGGSSWKVSVETCVGKGRRHPKSSEGPPLKGHRCLFSIHKAQL